MLKSLLVITRHEVLLTARVASSWLTPLLFFVIVVCVFPIALGPDSIILAKVAPAIIWVAALLAVLLSVGNIFRFDAEEGYLDLFLLSAHPLTALVACKILSHWLTHCLPLILISPVLGLVLNLNLHQEYVLVMTLLLGTPVLSLLGGIGAALMVGVRHQGLLLPVLIMPLYIPVLIFGTGTVLAANANLPVNGYFAIMGAFILLSLAFAPLMTGLALRIGVDQ